MQKESDFVAKNSLAFCNHVGTLYFSHIFSSEEKARFIILHSDTEALKLNGLLLCHTRLGNQLQ
jgi:hypothetical protein